MLGLVIAGGALLVLALGKRRTAAQPSAQQQPPKDGESGQGGPNLPAGGAGAAFGFAFGELVNNTLLKDSGYSDADRANLATTQYGSATTSTAKTFEAQLKTFDTVKAVLRGGSLVGFTVAGALLAIGVVPAVVVASITLGVIAVVLAIYVVLNPHPLKLADSQRDRAIAAYDAARRKVWAEQSKSLQLNFDAELTDAQRETYAASFADGFIRTGEAIAVESMRKAGLSEADIEVQRLSAGTVVGFTTYYDFAKVPNRNAVLAEIMATKQSAMFLGGQTFSADPGVLGKVAETKTGFGLGYEPVFPTLVEECANRYPNFFWGSDLKITTRVCRAYRNADKASFPWTYVHEYFHDTKEGRAFYAGGKMFAWGTAYVAAMLAGVASGKTPAQALAAGKASGLIHHTADSTSLTFLIPGEGSQPDGTLEFRWQDYADKALPPPEEG